MTSSRQTAARAAANFLAPRFGSGMNQFEEVAERILKWIDAEQPTEWVTVKEAREREEAENPPIVVNVDRSEEARKEWMSSTYPANAATAQRIRRERERRAKDPEGAAARDAEIQRLAEQGSPTAARIQAAQGGPAERDAETYREWGASEAGAYPDIEVDPPIVTVKYSQRVRPRGPVPEAEDGWPEMLRYDVSRDEDIAAIIDDIS